MSTFAKPRDPVQVPDGPVVHDYSTDFDGRSNAGLSSSTKANSAMAQQSSTGKRARPKLRSTTKTATRATTTAASSLYGDEHEIHAQTVTLDDEALMALENERQKGRTVREAILLAVRATQRQMERCNPELYEPDEDLPIVHLRPRRRLETPGTKVAVRLYGPEHAALQKIADRLGRSVSGLVSDALTKKI
jgi:hypothetical protein